MAAIHRPPLPVQRAPGRSGSSRTVLIGAVLLVIGAALLQVNQFSAVTGTGYQIEGLRHERAAKLAENHGLEAEVARLSSLARVEIEARVRLGMEPAGRVMHLEINGAVPEHQTLPTRYLPAENASSAVTADPPLWKRLLDLLPF
jgi:hypothetical protein